MSDLVSWAKSTSGRPLGGTHVTLEAESPLKPQYNHKSKLAA